MSVVVAVPAAEAGALVVLGELMDAGVKFVGQSEGSSGEAGEMQEDEDELTVQGSPPGDEWAS
jgi:hypothetical protein